MLGFAILAVAIWWVYWPAIGGGFLLDDDVLLTQNRLIAAPDGLTRFWFTTEASDYWPVTNSTLWLEWRLWRMNPTGYHVTNLVFHLLDSWLIWLVLRRLRVPGAFLAAILFAVHPVNVESVAWIAQRKNVLAMFFVLLSTLWYLRAESLGSAAAEKGTGTFLLRRLRKNEPVPGEGAAKVATATDFRSDRRWYVFSLIAFVLAMLSKGSVAVLPLLLLVIAWWQSGQITRRDWQRVAPFLLVAGVLTAVNIWFQTHGSGQTIRDATFFQRILGTGAALWFYLMKALVPIQLAFVYPQWNIETDSWRWWLPSIAAIVVTVWLWRQRNTAVGRPVLVAWTCFCIALLPVLGFTDVGFMRYSLVADHYQHLALVPILALVAAGVYQLYQRQNQAARPMIFIAAVGVVAVLAVLARNQSSLYANGETLYLDTLAKNPDSSLARYNLGVIFSESGRPKMAIPQFEAALGLKPDYPECETSLGLAQSRLGQTDQANEHYRHVLEKHPDYAEAHNNLGLALAEAGHFRPALEHYQAALKTKADSADVQNNFGMALAGLGRPDEAIPHYAEALRIDPENARAHNNWGSALAAKGQFSEAIGEYEQALQLEPDFAAALVNLGTSLAATGNLPAAIERFEKALRLAPENLDAAVYLSEAYAQVGRFSDAATTAQHALDLARANGDTQMAETIAQRLKALRQKATTADRSP